ncbi:zinc-binding dehydrogenase [Streptomyces himalayensis]|uniref:zinc-binding dehydrogenase n=1 Tax=Streptomyces himalayensis TaxID=2820085 RepID=UPI0035A86D98
MRRHRPACRLLRRGRHRPALAARDILGVNLGNRPTAETLTTLAELAATRELRVRIDAEVPLADAPAIVAKALAAHATGKTVIVP